ncbi:MAG: filamentation induced by cAMP protein Fic [Xanthobacteraceae bacterium]|nr:MAG: filamentation induced by cAMP protein Fic [Xanthobacteraceae bacterium]
MAGFSATQTLDQMPEVFISGTAISREVSRAVKAGKLRKLASRLYTRNLTDRPEAIIRRNLWNNRWRLFPRCADR